MLDGRIPFQPWYDKPEIICPGCWSCSPGGHLEVGETPDVKCHEDVRANLFDPQGTLAFRQHPVGRCILVEYLRQSGAKTE